MGRDDFSRKPRSSFMEDHPFVQRWLQRLEQTANQAANDAPNYWFKCPSGLLTTTDIHGNIKLGIGSSIYADSILPLVKNADSEVIIVTCFWATSATLSALGKALRKLSEKSVRRKGPKIKVRLSFSSLSLFQKLFHTTSRQGQTYSPSQWVGKLGLPSPDDLIGLDLTVKSIFIRPFSVLHPKFVIIDRKLVILPSCNISWEDWFEGSVTLSGDSVWQFLSFWDHTWASMDDGRLSSQDVTKLDNSEPTIVRLTDCADLNSRSNMMLRPVQSVFLPSPHHVNPQFSLPPWRECPAPPPTPLNTFLLTAIGSAQHSIYMQTPNLTSPPVLSSLLAALKRGIDVEVLTSERLMILEQLVTAGTTTSRCVRKLMKRHRSHVNLHNSRISSDTAALEFGPALAPGNLKVSYYRRRPASQQDESTTEPVQSHLKLTIVDAEWTVLGSGNMDRASWFTSQELVVAFFSKDFAKTVLGEVQNHMGGRTFTVYDSSTTG